MAGQGIDLVISGSKQRILITSCCGTMEQFRATEGTLNTLNFKKKKGSLALESDALPTGYAARYV